MMYSLNELVQELDELLNIIKKLEESIESELHDDESPFVYEGDCVINGVDLKGKSYSDIEYILDYIASNSDLNTNLALRSKIEEIKLEFINRMISDVAMEDHPKSYSLFSEYFELARKIEYLIKNGYSSLKLYYCIFSKDLLDSLKSVVTIDLLNAQRKINLSKNKDSGWLRRKKASSDYVKKK